MSRRTARAAAATVLVTLVASVLVASPARAANPATPGNFTGYGFDQCLTPTQKSMNTWLRNSPFLAVGIYISGKSRACRSQPNLTPAWVSSQLQKGWRLLPITLGPQASCSTRFPRYNDDPTIRPKRGAKALYRPARRQGSAEATSAVTAAKALGIVPGSTLWYDLEAFDHTKRDCRESALAFLTAWTNRLHALDYVSGVYSSAGSGIKVLDDARVNRPGTYTMPDRIWIARWDGKANTSTSYIRSDGWLPGGRMKQYQGGHNETLGRRHDQHRPQLLEPGQGLGGRARAEALPGHAPRLRHLSAAAPRQHPDRPGQGAAVPAQGAEAVLRQGQRCLQRRHHRRGQRLADQEEAHRPGRLEPEGVDQPARRGDEAGAQVRFGRHGRAPGPAGPERGVPQPAALGHRCLQPGDRPGPA